MICLVCENICIKSKKESGKGFLKRKFCSYDCAYIGRKTNKGKIFSEETRKKMSAAKKGKQPWLGKKHTEEAKRNISLGHIGLLIKEKHPNWKGGITPSNLAIRCSREYKIWRKSVFDRDNYTCVHCGQVGGKLNADHIKPFALFHELRLLLDNGRTLCVECHKNTDTYAGRTQTIKTRYS